jgi:hypothetical protein
MVYRIHCQVGGAAEILRVGAAAALALMPELRQELAQRRELRTWASLSPLPASHTLSFASTKMPCSVVGHSYPCPGPPMRRATCRPDQTRVTGGAGMQHSALGVMAAPAKRSFFRKGLGLCSTQM